MANESGRVPDGTRLSQAEPVVSARCRYRKEEMMPEEYFEIAHINFDEAVLHGRMMVRNSGGDRVERPVRVTLTEQQKAEIGDLQFKHQMELDKVLSRIAHEDYDALSA